MATQGGDGVSTEYYYHDEAYLTEIDKYQRFCETTWVDHYGDEAAEQYHAVLGLVGEAGEVAELFKKQLRGERPVDEERLLKQLGDVLYYLVTLARLFDFRASHVMTENMHKLQSRKERGVIRGSGDVR